MKNLKVHDLELNPKRISGIKEFLTFHHYKWEDYLWWFCLSFLGILATMFITWLVLCIVFLVDPGNPYN